MADEASPPQASILIADDNADARRLLVLLLQSEGHRLLVARDGPEALRIAERAPDLALILLDVMMPGLDGFEVCRRLRAREANRNQRPEAGGTRPEESSSAVFPSPLASRPSPPSYIPIILATALNDQAHLAEGLAAGADDYVTKPIVQAEVLARVRAALRLKRTTDELLAARELAAVGAMAVTLGHEINNPLSTVVGNLELLLQREHLEEKGLRRLQAAHEASLRIRELVQRLVSIQRVVITSYVGSARMLDIDHSCLSADPPSPPSPAEPLRTERP